MNNKKILTFSFLLIIVIILGVVVWGSNSALREGRDKNKKINSSLSSNIPIFFYGNTCPHCADVEEWMKKNKIEEKINIVKKEVYDNKENAKELVEAAKNCGLSTDSIGVPFLYAEKKCYIGTPDVISFISQKAGIEKEK